MSLVEAKKLVGADKYELIRILGEGGFGITWLARRRSDDRQVVVKKLRMERVEEWKAVELFEREAKVLSELDHPRIPDYLDHFTLGSEESPEGFALVQEYIKGRTLGELWRGDDDLSEAEMLGWFFGILEVLDYLYSLDPPVVHRDITPGNIMLREGDGTPYLIDFGTVQARLAEAKEISSTAAGTFGYAATEQFIGHATAASDLYGLAMTYLAMYLKTEPDKMPFANNRVQLREATADNPLDARLSLVLEAMSEPDAANRPQSAREVLDRLAPLRWRVARAPGAVLTKSPKSSKGQKGPMARWYDARKLCLQIPEGEFWETNPKLFFNADPGELQISADGTRAVHTTYDGAYLIDLLEMRMRQFVTTEIYGLVGGISDDGRTAAAFDSYRNQLHVLHDKDLTILPATLPDDFEAHKLAVSPEGAIVALANNERPTTLFVFDAKTGSRLQHLIGPDYIRELRFAPSGDVFYCVSDDGVWTYHRDCVAKHDELHALAFSPDGRRVAISDSTGIKVGVMENIEELQWKNEPHDIVTRYSSQTPPVGLRFSPDGGRLIMLSRDEGYQRYEDVLVVFDFPQNRVVVEVRDFFDPTNAPMSSVQEFGILADGDRVMVHGAFQESHSLTTPGIAIGVYSLSRNEPLGTLQTLVTSYRGAGRSAMYFNGISRVDDDLSEDMRQVLKPVAIEEFDDKNKRWTTPIWQVAHGFFGRVDDDAYLGKNGPIHILERPEIARKVMAGTPQVELLSDPEMVRCADLLRRVIFISQLYTKHRIESHPRRLINATGGLAHLLPEVVERARKSAEDAPRFGGQSARSTDRVTEAALLAAAQDLQARSPEEKEVIFEEMVAHEEAAIEAEKTRRRLEREADRQVMKERREAMKLEMESISEESVKPYREDVNWMHLTLMIVAIAAALVSIVLAVWALLQ